jgi:ribose-phosphate pyrophosphokinase
VKNNLSTKIKVLSCAALFADVMKLVHEHQSISNKFII